MENATKALLIAAAILVAVIIISIGLAVVRQGQEAVGRADLSEAEMEAFNAKFKPFEGKDVSTATVNALLNTVFSHNQATTDGNYVYVVDKSGSVMLSSTASANTKLSGSSTHEVTLTYTKGIVTCITIK